MAKRNTPRSMLQDYLESVPTTAPVKRTRARSRSPPNRPINETLPSQSKKRRRSSLAVKQTPRSMIWNYTQGNKTETPFVRASRRRSVTVTPASQDLQTDEITPRTAIQALLKEAPEETPVHRTIRETDELESDSDIHQLPNDTIDVLTSPFPDEDSGPITMSQKDRRQTRHQITLGKFSEGVSNRKLIGTRDKSLQRSDDEMSNSDILTLPNDTINVLPSPIPDDDDLPATISQRDRRQEHITLQQFEDGVRNRTAVSKADLAEMTSTSMKFTPSRRISQAVSLGDKDLTPSKIRASSISKIKSFLTPSRGTTPMEDTELNPSRTSVTLAIESPNKFQNTLLEGTTTHKSSAYLTKSRLAGDTRYLSPARLTAVSEMTKSPRGSGLASSRNLTPLKRFDSLINLESETDLTPSRRNKSVVRMDSPSDLTPSRRNKSVVRMDSQSDLTPSRRSKSVVKMDSQSVSTPPRGHQSRLFETEAADWTRSRRSESEQEDASGEDITPSVRIQHKSRISTDLDPLRRTRSRLADNSEADLTPSRKSRLKSPDLTPLRRSQSRLADDSGADLTPFRRSKSNDATEMNVSQNSQQEQNSNFGFNISDKLQNHDELALSVKHFNQYKLLQSQSERRSEKLTNTPLRTPLTSNQTILENIQPLSSSTPAKAVQIKQLAIETPKVNLKSPLLTSTPRRVPISQSPALTATPNRLPTANNTLKGTPGRVPVNTTNRSKVTDSNQRSKSKSRVIDSGLRSNRRSQIQQDNLVKSVNFSQSVPDTNDSEEEYVEDTAEIYKLKTPKLKDISRVPTSISSSTPALVKSKNKQRPPLKKKSDNVTVNKNKSDNINLASSKRRPSKKVMSTILSNQIIKQTFQHFCKMKVATDTIGELAEFTDTFFENTFKSLEAFAIHGGRKTVDESDVELMMKRQGLITEKTPLNVLVEKHLPLELREEIIPMARANNVVTAL